ncbi:hypothetical protein BDV35DRAFT_347874 [Aspergillus flavus]|uniref:Uncharacterized protein n=1 Tax=Aspergillus flavus TaxID=5059 RepID=A0A5N6H1J8_ASPFL|nr:hypothetical protein BDV35DRAFT_347874 [Aspergillus flavus]
MQARRFLGGRVYTRPHSPINQLRQREKMRAMGSTQFKWLFRLNFQLLHCFFTFNLFLSVLIL